MVGWVSWTRAPHPCVWSNVPLQTSVVSLNMPDSDRPLLPWERVNSPSLKAFKWRLQGIMAGLLQ